MVYVIGQTYASDPGSMATAISIFKEDYYSIPKDDSNTAFVLLNAHPDKMRRLVFGFTSPTELNVNECTQMRLLKVYGINF